ncbi:hypothetical protein [Shigella phage SfPhi01]|nr:hypothetical protein [Shigella phage SfPhi01]
MKSYTQFLNEAVLNEASSTEIQAVAKAAIAAGKYSYKDASDESRFQFARDMKAEGFTGNAVSMAWKSLVATGAAFAKASGKPAPKADPKVAQEKISLKELSPNMKLSLKSF